MNHYGYNVGKELYQMLNDGKPMSVFYKVCGENIDEYSGQDFFRYVKNGTIVYNRFFISAEYGKILYSVFTLPDQNWRFLLYKSLKKSKIWSHHHEFLESYLLGYVIELSNK